MSPYQNKAAMQEHIPHRRATARLMIDFGTPVTKIDSPRGESIVPQYALRPLQLRTKAATLKLPQMA